MTVNLVILLIVAVSAAVSLRWFLRAVRTPGRLATRLLKGAGLGLLALLLVVATVAGARGIFAVYRPPTAPVRALTISGSAEQLARGKYVTDVACMGCHGVNQGYPLRGGHNVAEAEGFGFMGDVIAENLTPAGKLASYTDGEVFRAIRHSLDREGKLLLEMSFLSVREISDDDIMAIIAHLRAQPAEPSQGATGDRINFLGMVMMGSGLFPRTKEVDSIITAPSAGVTPEYGRYVATLGGCRTCHGPEMAGVAASSVSPAMPDPRPFAQAVSLEGFVTTMRTGVRPDGKPFTDRMPWRIASLMTDEDLAALYAFLTAPLSGAGVR